MKAALITSILLNAILLPSWWVAARNCRLWLKWRKENGLDHIQAKDIQ